MNNEHQNNAALCAAYRALRPQAEVWKVNDRVARSRPDIEICDYGQTWYLEGKQEKEVPTPGQAHMLLRLRVASRNRACVVTYLRDGRVLIAYDAETGPAVHTATSINDAALTIEFLIASRAS